MEYGTQSVDICPRSLLAFVIVSVLLNRRIAWAQHGFGLIGDRANTAAGRAEIQQDGQAVILNLDVIQRDIAVQIAFVVDGFNCPKQHRQRAADPRFVDHLRVLFAQTGERGAAVKDRPHIGGVVLHPETQHVQQVRVIKTRQQARFLNKAVQSGGKGLTKALATQHQRHVVIAYRKR